MTGFEYVRHYVSTSHVVAIPGDMGSKSINHVALLVIVSRAECVGYLYNIAHLNSSA